MTSRVLLIGAEWFDDRPSGLTRYVKDLVLCLAARDEPVEAVVLGPATKAPGMVVPAGRRSDPIARRVRDIGRAAGARAGSVDLVDAHLALYGAAPLLFGPLRRTPFIVHFHGPWAAESREAGEGSLAVWAKANLERTLYRRARAVVTLSPAFAEVAVRDYGVDPERIHVIPPGVDLDWFSTGPRSAARERLGVGEDAFVVVCARRLERRMGIDLLLQAWASVQREVPDAVLLIAGAGSERPRLEAAISALPNPGGARLLERVEEAELRDLYRAADCSVVPTRALEGFGLVVLESLACGTPPVVTDVGGLPSGVRELDESLVVPAADPGALAERLVRASRGELPSRESCRRHAEGYSFDELARRHAELHDAVRAERASQATAGRRDRRLRVLFVDHTAVLSGGELALARLLSCLDVEAHVVLAEDGPLRERLEAAGATVHILAMDDALRRLPRSAVVTGGMARQASVIAYSVRLASLIRQLRPDVVHTNSLKAALYGGLAGRLARVKVVWHLRDRIAPDYLPEVAVTLVRRAARVLPAAVIANSASTLETLGHLSVPSVAIPSPIDIESQPAAQREGVLRVGIVGRIAPWKGQDLFLRAYARALRDSAAEAVVIGEPLFGEDDFLVELKQLAVELEIADRVDFRGFREDVGAELARLDIVVHASTVPEPFGQVVVEAMAAARAVVVADAGGPAEIVRDGETGLTYTMGDERALAACLERLAGDAPERERLGEAASRDVDRYRAGPIARDVRRLYASVVGW